MSTGLPWPMLAAAATLGLAGSAHCLGMCGGIAAAAGTQGRRGGTASGSLGGILFNLGRIAAYAGLGAGIAAVVGSALAGLPFRPVAVGLRMVAALLMLVLALNLLTGRDLLALEHLGGRFWNRIRPLAGRALALPPLLRFGVLGLLWGFLPCGLVYSALSLAAASGSAAAGGLVMLAFGLGTLPSMLAVTLAGGALTRCFSGLRTRRAAGVLMLLFALWTALGPMAPHAGRGDQAPETNQHMHH